MCIIAVHTPNVHASRGWATAMALDAVHPGMHFVTWVRRTARSCVAVPPCHIVCALSSLPWIVYALLQRHCRETSCAYRAMLDLKGLNHSPVLLTCTNTSTLNSMPACGSKCV
jgi:hypothetical protein